MSQLTQQEIERIRQAAELAQSGDYRPALDLIDGIHHPKVDQLRHQFVKAYRKQIADEVSPPKSRKTEFTPSLPILLLDEASYPQPESESDKEQSGSRWDFLKKWLLSDE